MKVNGHRIELGEIEETLRRYPGVKEATVTVSGQEGARHLIAYLVAPLDSPERESPPLVLTSNPEARERIRLRLKDRQRPCATSGFPLPRSECIDAPLEKVPRRRSHRHFEQAAFPQVLLGLLLAPLQNLGSDGERRFRYASAGGTYPISTFVYLREGSVTGLPGGTYAYDPDTHSLLLLNTGATLPPTIHWPTNAQAFIESAFSILFVAPVDHLSPLYGDAARDFCLIEAGLMTQLLEEAALSAGLGICQFGGLDFDSVRSHFGLGPDMSILHSMVGGIPSRITPAPLPVEGKCNGQQVEGASDGRHHIGSSAPFQHVFLDSLRQYLVERLPSYMVPARFVRLQAMPRNLNGKVDRAALPSAPEPLFPAGPKERPLGPTVLCITEAVARQIGLPSIDPDTNFFELGANSLSLVRAHREIRDRTGRAFPVVEMFRCPTASKLADYLGSPRRDDDGSSERASSRIEKRVQARSQPGS